MLVLTVATIVVIQHLTTTFTDYKQIALSQKGDPVESLKILRVYEGAKGALGESYVLVDFG